MTVTLPRRRGRQVVLAGLLSLLVLGGCRDGADRVDRSPAPPALLSADPLDGPETSLDAVERAVDADADTRDGR